MRSPARVRLGGWIDLVDRKKVLVVSQSERDQHHRCSLELILILVHITEQLALVSASCGCAHHQMGATLIPNTPSAEENRFMSNKCRRLGQFECDMGIRRFYRA